MLKLAVITALMLISVPALAQESGSRATREFVDAVAQFDSFERLEASTALAESTNENVRAFASEMLTVHTQAKEKLNQAIMSQRLSSPTTGLNGDQSMLLAALQSARGHDFDDLYFRQQELVHHAALATGHAYENSGDSVSLKAFAVLNDQIIATNSGLAERFALENLSN